MSSCCIGRLSLLPFSKYFVFFTPHRHTLKSPQNNITNQKVKTCTLKEDILTRDTPASAPRFLEDLYSESRGGRSSPRRRRSWDFPSEYKVQPYYKCLKRKREERQALERHQTWHTTSKHTSMNIERHACLNKWHMGLWCCRCVRQMSTFPCRRSWGPWGKSQRCRCRRCWRPWWSRTSRSFPVPERHSGALQRRGGRRSVAWEVIKVTSRRLPHWSSLLMQLLWIYS